MDNATDIIRDPTKCPKCVDTNPINPFEDITRLEVIQNSERKFVQWDCNIDVSLQDGGRTMKIFVRDKSLTGLE